MTENGPSINLSALLDAACGEKLPATTADKTPDADAALRRLADLLRNPDQVPPIGTKIADVMRGCFQRTAEDIERLSREHYDRAVELQQEAQTFAAIVRDAGEVLCARIEREAARGFQVSEVMTLARVLVRQDPPESPGGASQAR